MEANTFSYSIYKNEYESTMIEFFKQTFEVEDETEQIVTFTNLSQADCMNMAACMFKTVKNCKAIFPNVKTIEEEVAAAFDQMKELKSQMCDALLKVMNSAAFKAGGIKNADTNSKTFDRYEKVFYIANEMMRICSKY